MTLGGRCFSERKRKEDTAAVFDYSEGCYWGEDADKPAVRSCLLVCLFCGASPEPFSLGGLRSAAFLHSGGRPARRPELAR